MKWIVGLSIVLLIALNSELTSAIECYVGSLRDNQLVDGNFATQECNRGQVCMTRIETNLGMRVVHKTCKEREACRTQQVQNMFQCYNTILYRRTGRVCRFCCGDDLCNNFREIPEPRK